MMRLLETRQALAEAIYRPVAAVLDAIYFGLFRLRYVLALRKFGKWPVGNSTSGDRP